LFDLSSKRFKFDLDGIPYTLEARVKGEELVYSVERDDILVHQEQRAMSLSEFHVPYGFQVQTPEGLLRFVVGSTGLWSLGLEVYRGGALHWRSSRKPFAFPKWAQAFFQWADRLAKDSDAPKTAEQLAREADAKRLRPAIAVDIAFAVLFFFVAREYGLVTAAVAGAGATLILVVVDRFVKPDLTGGFAVFGAVMALISAGLALILQDDLAIKLRGSIMGLIGASFMAIDWLNDGRYLGRRFARYFYVFGAIDPKRASLAVCASGLLIVAIDTPLAFLLTTEQWIWYNAFLDSLIAIPIVMGAMWFARVRDS
jgi:intracellular septation protein A